MATSKKTGMTSFAGLKKGQKIRVLNNLNSNNWEVGKVYTLTQDVVNSPAGLAGSAYVGNAALNTIYPASVELVSSNLVEMKAELAQITKTYEEVAAELSRKIKFCTVNKVEEYDADIEKVYAVLGTLNSKSSRMDKAKVIAKLIKEA